MLNKELSDEICKKFGVYEASLYSKIKAYEQQLAIQENKDKIALVKIQQLQYDKLWWENNVNDLNQLIKNDTRIREIQREHNKVKRRMSKSLQRSKELSK